MYDLIIIGGGMAAMAAAIEAGKNNKKILLIDRNDKLGRKLYATGNGRCNITNENIDYRSCYNSDNNNYFTFLEKSLGEGPYEGVMDFLDNVGIKTKSINGYVYPMSLQASAFVWTLIDKLKEYGVEVLLKTEIIDITKENGIFTVKSDNASYEASKVLFACGGRSYSRLGGTESGYRLAESLGHTITKLRPALCGLQANKIDGRLAGVRAGCRVFLCDERNNIIASEEGELQLNQNVLSGIVIFNLSSIAGKLMDKGTPLYVMIDFIPGFTEEEIKNQLIKNQNRTVLAATNTLVNDRLATAILEDMSIDRRTKTGELSGKDLDGIIGRLKGYRVDIDGVKDYETAQVTAGGVDISEINYDFSSKKTEGLFLAGEMLDIDGLCGGYNITFAILSGIKAGQSI